MDIIIANFSGRGISSIQPDYPFLRNSLFPRNLLILKLKGAHTLYNIKFYDKWWRLIRSMKLIDKSEKLSNYYKEEQIPDVIKRMFLFQKRIPYFILRKGIFSKIFMFASYIINMPKFKYAY